MTDDTYTLTREELAALTEVKKGLLSPAPGADPVQLGKLSDRGFVIIKQTGEHLLTDAGEEAYRRAPK